MDKEKELKEIKTIEAEIINLKGEVRVRRQLLAEHFCPFTVGQRVLSSKGEEHEIASISSTAYPPFYKFKICKIKKDGSAYVNSQYAYRFTDYTAV